MSVDVMNLPILSHLRRQHNFSEPTIVGNTITFENGGVYNIVLDRFMNAIEEPEPEVLIPTVPESDYTMYLDYSRRSEWKRFEANRIDEECNICASKFNDKIGILHDFKTSAKNMNKNDKISLQCCGQSMCYNCSLRLVVTTTGECPYCRKSMRPFMSHYFGSKMFGCAIPRPPEPDPPIEFLQQPLLFWTVQLGHHSII